MSWLLREDDVLAAVEEARPGWPVSLRGAMVRRGPAVVHTLTVSITLDLAWCYDVSGDNGATRLEVRRIGCLAPRRLARPHLGRGAFIVAAGGAFERWHLRIGDQLEIREAQEPTAP